METLLNTVKIVEDLSVDEINAMDKKDLEKLGIKVEEVDAKELAPVVSPAETGADAGTDSKGEPKVD